MVLDRCCIILGMTEEEAYAEACAEWFVGEIEKEARRLGYPLDNKQSAMLRKSILTLTEAERPDMIWLNNRVVTLARSAMDHAKASGAPTVKVRRGLRIPEIWESRYDVVYGAECDWVIAAILQNAMIQNPMANETRPWKSK